MLIIDLLRDIFGDIIFTIKKYPCFIILVSVHLSNGAPFLHFKVGFGRDNSSPSQLSLGF